jgi:hypothetical protein
MVRLVSSTREDRTQIWAEKLKSFCGTLGHYRPITRQQSYLNAHRDHFLPFSFQFIIYCHLIFRRYINVNYATNRDTHYDLRPLWRPAPSRAYHNTENPGLTPKSRAFVKFATPRACVRACVRAYFFQPLKGIRYCCDSYWTQLQWQEDKGKGKVTLKQATKAHRRSKSIALHFL